MGTAPPEHWVIYRNAKVVLLGDDTGVGKTALAMVLTSKKFQPTESTHGRKVLTLDTRTIQTGPPNEKRKETREVMLWDLAGQPGYPE